ncbi:hypothetical protein ACOSP7_020310 [Xanthoceras sorbifolium]
MNTIFSISKFIDLNTFSSPVNGYLFDNTCVFGVEVFVVKNTFKEGRLSMMRDLTTYDHTWTVTKLSSLVNETYVSETFGCYKWNIVLYPNGNEEGKGNSISIYLDVSCSSFPPNSNLFVEFILRVKDQTNGKHKECKASYLYATSNNFDWGWSEFLSLAKLKDSKRGYLVNDAVTW